MNAFLILVVIVAPAQDAAAPAAPSQSAVRAAIESFGYRRVRLDDGPLRHQVDAARDDYLRIPNDDLLRGFRLRAGKPAPGVDLGGWYTADVFHVFGQILSGLARLSAATGDVACREKAEALLSGWAECIEPDGYFFYSRKPNAPHYIYDKIVGGLADMILYCDSRQAARELAKITRWAEKNLDRSNAYAFGPTEWYTLSENLYRAFQATGDQSYRDFARVWHYNEYWGIYARKGDLFGDRGGGRRTTVYHAYSHVNTLGGLARLYGAEGDRRHLDALIYAHDLLTADQCYATGGFGPDEQLLPRAEWLKKSDYTHNSFETQCGCFAVFKLCKYLMTFTGNARFGDWIERLVYNGLAATIPMSPDGHVFYYSDYNSLGGAKRNHGDRWTCCTGTRPMALADLCDLVYFHDPTSLYVNLFVPSTLVWDRTDGPIRVRQVTRFPETESTELIVSTAKPATFGLKLRVPAWLAGPLGCTVNGQAVAADVDQQGWANVRRVWLDGDRIVVRLPMKLEARPLDRSSPAPTVLMRGPIALAARSQGPIPSTLWGGPGLDRALVPCDGEPLTFHAKSDANVFFRPFYAVRQGEPYFLYLDPNRASHRAASFDGGDWRESESFRFSDRVGASASFPFHGSGIRWIGFRFDDAGIAELKIDGRPVGTVDQYAPTRGAPFEWRKTGLPDGDHRLTITVLEKKPTGSKGRFVNVAGFEVIR